MTPEKEAGAARAAGGGEAAPEAAARVFRASVVKPAILGAVVLAAGGVVYLSPLREVFRAEQVVSVRAWIRGFGLGAPAVFFLVTAAGVAGGAPRIFFAALGGAAFGFVAGMALAEIATLAGCLLAFGYGRWLGRDFVDRRLGGRLPRLRGLLDVIGRHGILANVLVRAAPVGNCFVANLLMSVSPITLRHYVIGTVLGTLPETVIYALFGSGASGQAAVRWTAAGTLLLLLGLVYTFLVRRFGLARTIATGLAAAPDREVTR